MRFTSFVSCVLVALPAFAAQKTGEGPCKDGSQCAKGTCVEINGDSYCSQSCGTCPSGMVCDAKLFEMVGVKVCLKGSAEAPPRIEEKEAPPSLPCATDKQCPKGLICAEMHGQRDCTKPCAKDDECVMPETMGMKIDFWSCQADAGSKKKPRQACLPKASCIANPMSCMSIDASKMMTMPGMTGIPGGVPTFDQPGIEPGTGGPGAPTPKTNVAQISAKLEGNKITLGDKRVFEIKEQKLMMPYPELEMTAPDGARVELFYGDKSIHAEEVPFLYKQLQVDKYLKLVVSETSGTWTVKFIPKTQHKTTIRLAGAAAATPTPATPAPAPAAAAGQSCQKTVLAKGHHSMNLSYCDGVDAACAVAVLEAGHHPQNLSYCEPGLPIGCVRAVLGKGHHPQNLSYCEGVNVECAKSLLDSGEHPMNLSNCGD